jgi:hypothetical protein
MPRSPKIKYRRCNSIKIMQIDISKKKQLVKIEMVNSEFSYVTAKVCLCSLVVFASLFFDRL